LLCLVAIFFILVITIYKVLQESSFFKSSAATAVIAICVSLLSVIGMIRFFVTDDTMYVVSNNSVDKHTNLDFILIPYVALGILIILMLLLKFIFKKSEKYGLHRFNKVYPQDIGKKHTSDRRAEVWKNTDEKSYIKK
jgi:membrane protease YdiL (CAAX protease family)